MYTLGYSGFTRDSRLGIGLRSPLAKTNQGFNNIFDFREGEVPFSHFPLGYFGHDASAAILHDGKILACASEERFTRVKFSLNLAGNTLLPFNAINYCLKTASISPDEVDIVAHYCRFTSSVIKNRLDLLLPSLSLEEAEKMNRSYNEIFNSMMNPEIVIRQYEHMMNTSIKKFIPVDHHYAHAASAFFPSGLHESVILTIDGTGELESSLLAVGEGDNITEMNRTLLPTSLGALYLIFTVYLGFKSLGDEYKVMGLAPYGNPARFRDFFKSLIILNDKGTYSTPWLSKKGFKEHILENLGHARTEKEPVAEVHADVAAALQESIQEAVLHTLKYARSETGIPNLCMAGGVALNCSLNGAIARSRLFKKIFVQPASSDEGCSLGAALYTHFQNKDRLQSINGRCDHVYLGPSFSNEEILLALLPYTDRLRWTREENISASVAKEIAAGKVIGWFQGKMEFGPRALGNRSILADPRDPGMKDRINAKVKRRESFRPFAPAVLEEEADNYFDLCDLHNSPFMLFAFSVKNKTIPAVTHVDGSARIQTVSKDTNPLFWNLISEFKKITGVPVILNTSFNVKNEPIVCTPADAIKCFLSTDIDLLAAGDFYIEKRKDNE
jgi:carbamoyltransferase